MDFKELEQAVGELDESAMLSMLDEVMKDGGSQAKEMLLQGWRFCWKRPPKSDDWTTEK